MKRFSIIIPLHGDRRSFDDTLASVLRHRPDSSQIIVVHDGSYDNPYEIQDEIDFVVCSTRAGLIRYFNSALDEATGQYIALLRPGVRLNEGWSYPVEIAFQNPQVASVSPMIVTPGKRTTMIAAGVTNGHGYRRQIVGSRARIIPRTIRRIVSLGPTSWAAFYRRESVAQIGVCGDGMHSHYLDLDLALSLKAIGYQCEFCPNCVVDIEDPALITEELVLSHGRSAQRAYCRYRLNQSWLPSFLAMAWEIFSSSIEPWKFRHAIERRGARRFVHSDLHYADLLSILARKRRRENGNSHRIFQPDWSEIESRRRAS